MRGLNLEEMRRNYHFQSFFKFLIVLE